MAKKCKKRKHKSREAAYRIAHHLSKKYEAKMGVYRCNKCKGGVYHLTEIKELHFTEVITRKRRFQR